MFYSHCGNLANLRDRRSQRKYSSWFSFWKKEERSTWLAKFLRMNELKDQVCSSWFAPVGSASDYPLLSKWVIYGEVRLYSIPSFIHLECIIPPPPPAFILLFNTVILCFAVRLQWKWMRWFIWWNFSLIFTVGYIHRSLHCQLCSWKVNRVSDDLQINFMMH